MTDTTRDAVTEQIRRAEGFRPMPYLDTAGVWTIGYGRAIGRVGISRAEADILLQNDLAHCLQALTACDWWRDLDDVRQGAILELCFQLGYLGLIRFKRMIAALRRHDCETAANELLDSKYAIADAPGRAQRLARVLRTGRTH